jgi:transposase-like protein
VALAHGLNANMLRKWVIDGQHKLAASAPTPAPLPEAPQMPPPTFVPLALRK